ncbi:hypothetical protein [Glaciecola petra]|uniref:PEP-CTERM sorting domain-containing protein n=1 Tax=Glaciecola petra TaxID=3075602 RepID=A0ABU2ZP91_9ALTE|nr:hypothetical protein [Aestuariibacter sp. P117]MDT0593404.1 hypothetical protein [Aestuariibacter sp. P117]
MLLKKHFFCVSSLFSVALFSNIFLGTVLGNNAQAAIITQATSELEYTHNYSVNNGRVPEGIRLSTTPQTLSIGGNARSEVDEESAINENASEVQVANPFSNPVLPYEARRNNRTTFNAGAEGAQSDYDISVRTVNDPDADPTASSIIQRDTNNSGAAELVLLSQTVAAEAESRYNMTRGYTLENISNQRQQFFITGNVSFDLFSEYEGLGGFANSAMSLFTLFENVAGVNATLDLTSVYDPDIVQSNANASVFERLTTNEPNFGGFLLSTSARAEGGGNISTASISEAFSYRILIDMDVGTRFDFLTGFSQRNTVLFDPQSVEVNGPAISLLFSVSLVLLGFKRYGKSRHH